MPSRILSAVVSSVRMFSDGETLCDVPRARHAARFAFDLSCPALRSSCNALQPSPLFAACVPTTLSLLSSCVPATVGQIFVPSIPDAPLPQLLGDPEHVEKKRRRLNAFMRRVFAVPNLARDPVFVSFCTPGKVGICVRARYFGQQSRHLVPDPASGLFAYTCCSILQKKMHAGWPVHALHHRRETGALRGAEVVGWGED